MIPIARFDYRMNPCAGVFTGSPAWCRCARHGRGIFAMPFGIGHDGDRFLGSDPIERTHAVDCKPDDIASVSIRTSVHLVLDMPTDRASIDAEARGWAFHFRDRLLERGGASR